MKHVRDFTIICHVLQIVQENNRNGLESWRLWQTMNCSVEDIVVSGLLL